MDPLRILLVADVQLIREGLARLIARAGRLSLAGTAGSEREAGEAFARLRPDAVVLDMEMRGAAATARRIAAFAPEAIIVAIAVPDRGRDVLACVEAGVTTYVTRDASFADLERVVADAVRGEVAIAPRIAAELLRRLRALAAAQALQLDGAGLTPRETQILRLVDEGLSNKEIAARLVVEVPTVKRHVQSILAKLGVHSRWEAAAHARALRLQDGPVSSARRATGPA